MIIREWRGRALASKADDYPAHFRKNVVPAFGRVEGFRGAQLSRRQMGDRIEFLVVSRWASMAAIRGFAGDDVSRAVIDPEAVAALTDFDPDVRHYEVLEEVSA